MGGGRPSRSHRLMRACVPHGDVRAFVTIYMRTSPRIRSCARSTVQGCRDLRSGSGVSLGGDPPGGRRVLDPEVGGVYLERFEQCRGQSTSPEECGDGKDLVHCLEVRIVRARRRAVRPSRWL